MEVVETDSGVLLVPSIIEQKEWDIRTLADSKEEGVDSKRSMIYFYESSGYLTSTVCIMIKN